MLNLLIIFRNGLPNPFISTGQVLNHASIIKPNNDEN
jgi:hypothetical protein